MEILQRAALFGKQSGLLLLPQSLRRDFRQLVGAGFSDEDGDFVIGWLAAMFQSESLDGGVPLHAAHAVLLEQFVGDTANLKTAISAFGITARLNFISQAIYFPRQ